MGEWKADGGISPVVELPLPRTHGAAAPEEQTGCYDGRNNPSRWIRRGRPTFAFATCSPTGRMGGEFRSITHRLNEQSI